MADALGQYLGKMVTTATHLSGKAGRIAAGKIVFGTSGAIDATNSKHPDGFSASKPTGTGKYRLAFPPCENGFVIFQYKNADSAAVIACTGGAMDVAAGTADFQVFTNTASDAAADATSGDYVHYIFWGDVA